MRLDLDIDTSSLLDAFRRAPQETERGLFRALINIGNKVQTTMRSIHRYVTRSGSLDRAIGYKTNRSKLEIKMGIPFDPTNATITSNEKSYGVPIIEGHGTWTPDSFVVKGADMEVSYIERQLKNEINNINRRIF